MLTPFDDFPIHPSGDPIAHPATGDPNHYDRYWFNGTDKDAAFYFGAAMGHYPVRDVIDAAFSVILDGVEHSIFASGRMPWDRATAIGPIRIEVVEPMRVIRYVVADNDQGITADLTFRAKTVAIEEPRQTRVRDGILFMDNTRLTQWGSWEGSITVDGRVLEVHADTTPGTRDRSWGTRPVGEPFVTNRPPSLPEVFWLWAPLHFDDMCTHLALHETSDGNRWVEQGLLVPLLDTPDSPTCGVHPAVHLRGVRYELDFIPGRRDVGHAVLSAQDPTGQEVRIELTTQYTFRMRGIGYSHPTWKHGSAHGELAVGRESMALSDFDPLDPANNHIQNVVLAKWGDRTGVGVLEQVTMGPHRPTGLTGFLDGPA